MQEFRVEFHLKSIDHIRKRRNEIANTTSDKKSHGSGDLRMTQYVDVEEEEEEEGIIIPPDHDVKKRKNSDTTCRDPHYNQMSYYKCPICSPKTYKLYTNW